MPRTYLDHNASSSLRPAARDAMVAVLEQTGNASSIHREGRAARAAIERARKQVAGLVGCPADGIIFTSGATEAAHLGLTPDIEADGVLRPASRLYVSAVEHPCVLAGGRFAAEQITHLPVNRSGVVESDTVAAALAKHDYDEGLPFFAVQLVNSETGIVQQVAEIARMVRLKGGYVLCDAVQAAGRMPIDIATLGVDFLLLSAHKFGGPQGVGALVCSHDILRLSPVFGGGGQELKRRAGTENIAAIVGMGVAAEEAAADATDYRRLSRLTASIEAQLAPICAGNGVAPERLAVFGEGAQRVGNTICFAVNGLRAETALIAFDLDGVALSSGSACSSGKVGKSHVLAATAVDEELARGALRVSLGWNTTADDADAFLAAFDRITRRLGVMLNEDLSGVA